MSHQIPDSCSGESKPKRRHCRRTPKLSARRYLFWSAPPTAALWLNRILWHRLDQPIQSGGAAATLQNTSARIVHFPAPISQMNYLHGLPDVWPVLASNLNTCTGHLNTCTNHLNTCTSRLNTWTSRLNTWTNHLNTWTSHLNTWTSHLKHVHRSLEQARRSTLQVIQRQTIWNRSQVETAPMSFTGAPSKFEPDSAFRLARGQLVRDWAALKSDSRRFRTMVIFAYESRTRGPNTRLACFRENAPG